MVDRRAKGEFVEVMAEYAADEIYLSTIQGEFDDGGLPTFTQNSA